MFEALWRQLLREREIWFRLVVGYLVFVTVPPWVESQLWPVSGPLHITQVTQTEEGVRIRGWAERYRSGCDFLGLVWWLGDRHGQAVRVPARFDDRPQIRAVGRMEFEALVVGLSEDQLNDSYSDVRHACHGRNGDRAFLWPTRSKFWN
ncbi:hypothetical protein RPE78_09675 [Thioclava litoralis]|uniref:DUF4131 domain-containing protein n=1 Tax=Thioclava litoralis TaxID=3076557 RepID=A0ABZ1DXJ0_9RHOB|nr:hypothetical protein RPE78_09675 [Thioclava sp. FTW29]